jgi:hypothetical protein
MRGDLAPGQDAGRQIHPVRQSSDSGIQVGRLFGLTDRFHHIIGKWRSRQDSNLQPAAWKSDVAH